MNTSDDEVSRELIAKIDGLVQRTESFPDVRARELATELVQAVMALHASALARVVEIASASGGLQALTADDLVSSVLVLHGVHPDDVETRVRRAFERLRTYFDSRGGRIELLELNSERVHLRVSGSRPGFADVARRVVEDALSETVPEIDIVIDGLEGRADPAFVPLSDILSPPVDAQRV